MRIAVVLLFFWASLAAAIPPPPEGLNFIENRYIGTWEVAETAFATDFSRPGTKQYDLARDCAITAAVVDCKLMANGTQQGEQRFTWDAAAHIYHVDMDIGGRPQPPLTLTVNGQTWTFLQTVPGPDGKPIQLRIQRQYRNDREVSYSASYSRDGTNWTVMTRGTEILKDTAPAAAQ